MCRELERYTYSGEINPRGRLYQTHKCRQACLNACRMNSNMHKHIHTHTNQKPCSNWFQHQEKFRKQFIFILMIRVILGFQPEAEWEPYLNMSCEFERNNSCFMRERLTNFSCPTLRVNCVCLNNLHWKQKYVQKIRWKKTIKSERIIFTR